MKFRNLHAALLGLCFAAAAPAGWSQQPATGQGKPEAGQDAQTRMKAKPAAAATAAGAQAPKQDGQQAEQDRREKAAQAASNQQKKARESSSTVTSNMK